MCNLYSMTRNRDAILRLFRVSHNRAVAVDPLPAIFPGYQAPVIAVNVDGERELILMNWGFMLLKKDRAPGRVTNVRDDKIRTSNFWQQSFEQRRCVVPASSYCEPKGEKPATWHWFALKGDEPRPLFAFPGEWTHYTGPTRKGGEKVDLEVFAFMTTEPNALTASINQERMPVLQGSRQRSCRIQCSGHSAQTPPVQAQLSTGARANRRARLRVRLRLQGQRGSSSLWLPDPCVSR